MSDGVDAPSGGPGSALKSAREALNVSEREVADALNLPLNVVEAMEANDYKNLPPAVFTRGYMRSYAKLLELDPEAIIARLPESAQPEVTLTAEMAAVEPTSRKLTDQPVWLRGAAIGALSILVIIVAVWLWPDADEALDTVPISAEAVTVPVVPEPKTLAPANQPAGPAASAAVADDRLGSGVEPEVNTLQLPELVPGQAEVTESPGEQISSRPESPDDVSTLRDRTSAPLVSGDAPGPAEAPRNQPTVPAAQQLAPAPTPSGMRRISPFGDDVLSISFVQDCWVDVKDRDGNRLYGDLNRAGTTIQLIGRAPFRVLLGYAPGVQMTFNDDVVEITQYTRNNVASLTVGDSMTQAVRGMRDVLPVEARRWRAVEAQLHDVLDSFAYEEVQLPLLEFTELFSRGVGEATDIVEKEMYTLKDRDGDSITLRPEGTAGCVRALQQHGMLYNQTQRVFYRGPMFRYERPQRGRYRQFYQLGVEVFGLAGPDIDAELLSLCAQFWRRLGIDHLVQLELNSLGSSVCRSAYRNALVDYLTPLREDLDEESQRRLSTNPLRILDSKSAATQAVLASAPPMSSFLDDASQAHFDTLCRLLTDLGVAYVLNSKLVRGLDYYTDTVFEWTTSALGAQGTICGGGRYDGLVELLGGKPTPGAGFAMGLERVALLCEQTQDARSFETAVDVYCCVMEPGHQSWAQNFTQTLRDALPGLRMRVHAGGGKLKAQLKKADVSGARWALIVGADEVADNKVTVKSMSGQVPQQTLAVTELIELMNRSTGD